MSHAFSLRCLGSPALFTASGELVRFRTRKHLALLVRMALEPGKQFTRDYLADLLWPEASPHLANHSLAQGLSVIKAKVAREAVVIQRATVGLAAGWIDVDTTHLGACDVPIDGPFLDGFELPAARPFEEWKDQFRARLAPKLRDCLVKQMDAARRIGDFPTVERHALRLQDLDPLAEEAIRGIMEARAWASDRSGALKAFARYETRLLEELDAKPGPDLVRMVDLLRDGRRTPSRPAIAGYPPERVDRRFEPETLIGREREFSVLFDAWTEARRKSPRIVVVTSDPGVGKTTLVNAFASSCQMDGAVVARAQAYDAERELPFAVLGEIVKQLAMQRAIGGADPEALSELTRISSEIARAYPGVPKPVDWSPELMPLRIADAFLKAITAAAVDAPVMVVVDDIHAADNASTAIIHSVARKLGGTRVLVVLTGRTSELRLSGAPWSLASDPAIRVMHTLDLQPLTDEAAEQLIRNLIQPHTSTELSIPRVLRASGGNPLAIELITREWVVNGPASLLRDLDALDTQPAPTIGIPRAISAVFDRQSRRLSPEIRATLDLAAVLGRRLTQVTLYAAIERSAGQAAESLSRLLDEGYLREVSGELEFRNELIRAHAYYSVAATTRLHLHRRVAEILSQSPGPDPAATLEIAWHYLRGGDVDSAVPFAVEGAEAMLAVGAPHGAEEILKVIARTHPQKRIRVLLAKALVDQSKGSLAVSIIDELVSEKDLNPREEAQVAMLRAVAEFQVDRESGGRYELFARAALDAAKKSADNDLIYQAVFECARAGTEEGVSEIVRVAEHEVEQLATSGDIVTQPMAILTRGYCRFFFRDLRTALECLNSYKDISSLKANMAQIAFVYSGIGITNHFMGRFDDGVRAHLAALELTKKVGDDARVSTIGANLCTTFMHQGNYDDAIRYGEMSVRYGESCRSSTLLISYTNLMDPLMLVGREAAATECFEKARNWIGPERRWKLRLTFLVEAASFALIHRNIGLALDLIGQLESLGRGREDAVPMAGAYWKLRTFRMIHLGHSDEAYAIVNAFVSEWRDRFVLAYLDMLAMKAWIEKQVQGALTRATHAELQIFDQLGAIGKRELLVLQGFLEPTMIESTNRDIQSPKSRSSLAIRSDARSAGAPTRFHTD